MPGALQNKLRFVTNRTLEAMFDLPPDITPVPVTINRLDNQTLVRYYEAEWNRCNELKPLGRP